MDQADPDILINQFLETVYNIIIQSSLTLSVHYASLTYMYSQIPMTILSTAYISCPRES